MQPAAVKEAIGMDVLELIDVRVGTIERVEEVAGSEKLVRLIVDFGGQEEEPFVQSRTRGARPSGLVIRKTTLRRERHCLSNRLEMPVMLVVELPAE